MSERIPKRTEVPVEDTWDLTPIFASDEAFDQAADVALRLPEKIAAFRGTLGSSGETLLKWYRLCDEVKAEVGALLQYATLKGDEDLGNSASAARRGRAVSLAVSVESASAFADPEIMAIPDEVLETYFKETEGLELYRRAIMRTRQMRAHTLSAPEEKLLASSREMAEAPGTIGSVFRDADLIFPKVRDKAGEEHDLTQGTYIMLMESPDRELRKNTFMTFYHTWASHGALSAAILDSQIKAQTFYARARGYESNLEAALFVNEVPVSVYTTLIETVHRHMGAMYRYMDLRRRALHLDELHMYDLYNSMAPEAGKRIPYAEAQKAVLEAVKPLGDDYASVVRRAYAERWVDVYENIGKRGGAYSTDIAEPHPYILLNYKDNLNSQFTLVHETGHAMHSYLSSAHQPAVYKDYVIFVAEVASTCNEVLMMKHLLGSTTDRTEREALINYFLEQFRTTLYRQTMFAEFELEINRRGEAGETLTAETLNALYYDLNKLYYGDGVAVDREIAEEWARIPHFFYNFYVYQYATGFSAAIALAEKILTGGQSAVEDYLAFLSSGCSKDPISLLKMAGVDMSSPAPVDAALDEFDDLVTEMEKLIL